MRNEEKGITAAAVTAIIIIIIIIAGAAVYFATRPKAKKAAPAVPKLAMVYTVPINDWGWGTTHYNSWRHLKDIYGENIDTEYSELVPYVECPRVLREYAAAGYKFVYLPEPWRPQVMKVADDYPDAYFLYEDSWIRGRGHPPKPLPPNVMAYDDVKHQADYLAGMLSGYMTETNHIGLVGGEAYPLVVRGAEAFKQGAKDVNPDVEFHEVWLGTWVDPVKGREVTLSMIEEGVDVVWEYADQGGLGVHRAAMEENIYTTGGDVDKSSLFPDTILACRIRKTEWLLENTVGSIFAGTWENRGIRLGLATGDTDLVYNPELENKIPDDVKAAIAAKKDAIINGDFIVPDSVTGWSYGEDWQPYLEQYY